MKSNEQDTPPNTARDSQLPEEKIDSRPEVSSTQQARRHHENPSPTDLLMKLLASVPPRDAGKWIKRVTIQQLVFVLSQMGPGAGADSMLIEWSRLYLQSLESFNIHPDIDRLEGLGIRRETVAIAMMAIKLAPHFDDMFGSLGDKRTRRRRAKTLLSPIPVLQDLAAIFGKPPAELPMDKIPNPTKLISELKFFSSIFNWGEWLYEFLGVNSLFEVSRFALASLVFEITGKFLDREVSNLVGASLGDYDYDENRHRVWRISNYERLQRNAPIATRLLVALNTVVPQS
jgi:hypothetical protein